MVRQFNDGGSVAGHLLFFVSKRIGFAGFSLTRFPLWVGHLVCWITVAFWLIRGDGLILPDSSRFVVFLERPGLKCAISVGAGRLREGAKRRDFSTMTALHRIWGPNSSQLRWRGGCSLLGHVLPNARFPKGRLFGGSFFYMYPSRSHNQN